MSYEPNDQNYQTSNSRIASFNDFSSNVSKEKEELKKVDRSTIKNNDDTHQIPGNRRYKFNRVTRKMDDLSKGEIKDKLDSIGVENPKHKWKATIPEQQGKNEAKGNNYMFFSNLESISRMVEDLRNLDELSVEKLLGDHDWAKDHIATSKDDVEEVYNFFVNKIK